MTDSEIEQLLYAVLHERGEQWMVDLVYVGVNTGMRLGEILSLGIIQKPCKYSFSAVRPKQARTASTSPPKITGERPLDEHCLTITSSVRGGVSAFAEVAARAS